MAQHKWHKEIIHWANGGEIECKYFQDDKNKWSRWMQDLIPLWHDNENVEYRIKPQPKEEKYWLCCGSLNYQQHHRTCCEAQVGHKERCRFGTAKEHSDWSNGIEPKEPKYLYAFWNGMIRRIDFATEYDGDNEMCKYIGKIKLEDDDA